VKVIEIWECEIDDDEIDDDEIDALSSAFKYVCDSEIKLTQAHNLLIYESQNEYMHVDILTM